jgi:hypothetical protein
MHIMITVVKRFKGSKCIFFVASSTESNQVCFLLYGQPVDKIKVYVCEICRK